MRYLVEFTPIDWRTSRCRGCGDVFTVWHEDGSGNYEERERLRDHDCEYFQSLESKLP